MTPLSEVRIVGCGMVASLLDDMGYATVADLRAVDTEDAMCDFIRRAQRSVDRLRSIDNEESGGVSHRDWGRIARKAYRVLLAVRAADLSDTGDVPAAFRCPLTLDWMDAIAHYRPLEERFLIPHALPPPPQDLP